MNCKKIILFTSMALALLSFKNAFCADYQVNINKSQNDKIVQLRDDHSNRKTEITIINDIKVHVSVRYNDGVSSVKYYVNPGDTLFLYDDRDLDNVPIVIQNYLGRTIFKGDLPNHSVSNVSTLSSQ